MQVEMHAAGARLIRADLAGANLYRATLTEADLTEANLYRADLRGADLSQANLSGANLSGARLFNANLSGTLPSDAQLAKACGNALTVLPEGVARPAHWPNVVAGDGQEPPAPEA